jgi:hypothetical protein
VRDDILARRLSILGEEGWKDGFEQSLSRVRGLKEYLEEARSIRGRGQVVTRQGHVRQSMVKIVDC